MLNVLPHPSHFSVSIFWLCTVSNIAFASPSHILFCCRFSLFFIQSSIFRPHFSTSSSCICISLICFIADSIFCGCLYPYFLHILSFSILSFQYSFTILPSFSSLLGGCSIVAGVVAHFLIVFIPSSSINCMFFSSASSLFLLHSPINSFGILYFSSSFSFSFSCLLSIISSSSLSMFILLTPFSISSFSISLAASCISSVFRAISIFSKWFILIFSCFHI